jgi:hypothetical protein
MPKKPALSVRPPPAVDPAAARTFIAIGDVHKHSKTSKDIHKGPATPAPEARPRAPFGSKTLVERGGGKVRRRMTVYLPPALADRLVRWCEANGREMSHTIAEAVGTFLKRKR